MFWEYALLVFTFDFLTEVFGVLWVLSVNRHNKFQAVFYTCITAALTRGALYFIIDDRNLLVVSGMGEILGTLVGMVIDEKRKKVKKLQKRMRAWFTHSVLRKTNLPRENRRKPKKENNSTNVVQDL